jgi:transposase InsO family protein
VTVIKLLDGTRTYLHAAIDNFSRRILAWKLVLHLEPNTTCQILADAAKHLPAGSDTPSVVADSGVENVNEEVNASVVVTAFPESLLLAMSVPGQLA